RPWAPRVGRPDRPIPRCHTPAEPPSPLSPKRQRGLPVPRFGLNVARLNPYQANRLPDRHGFPEFAISRDIDVSATRRNLTKLSGTLRRADRGKRYDFADRHGLPGTIPTRAASVAVHEVSPGAPIGAG